MISTARVGRSTRFPHFNGGILAEALSVRPWQALQSLSALPYPIFFDSSMPHERLSRYSYVTADPFGFLRCHGKQLEWPLLWKNARPRSCDPFQAVREALAGLRIETRDDLPPFQGGVAGLFGYDLAHHIERLPRHRLDEFQTPNMALGFYDWVYAYDHHEEQGWLISTGFPETEPLRRRERAKSRLEPIHKRLADSTCDCPGFQSKIENQKSKISLQHALPHLPELTSNFSREAYLKAIRKAIDYVHAGDCFQVNISQRLLAPCREHPLELYARLRQKNPSTFGGYFDLGDFVVASASPERFLKLNDMGEIETRPIKGTRPRGKTQDEDRRFVEELLASSKDRAENIMIVDLLRNDLGRVCEYGSVRVTGLCEVESYRTVHHLVSTVRGKLREGKDAVDLLKASFPGGSVTGAPKIRAMEIIAELEPTARGPYCGSLGWIGFSGAMDTNILIRTFNIGKGWVQFPVGGGIVADSDPEKEYEETLHKAEGMIRALR